jgi:branched-chain amino acid transport system substrate-binding protein
MPDGTQFGSQTRRSVVNITKVAIVAAVIALIAAACGTGSEGEGGGGEDSGTLKIGVATAQTGFLAPYDQPSLRGFRMKVDEINRNGGIDGKTKIELDIKDTQSDPAQTAVAAQELIDSGIQLLVTPCDADPSIAAGQISQEAQVPTISLCASTPTLPPSVGDYMFSNFPGDNFQAWAAARYAREQGYETAYVLKSPDTAYTNKLPEYFIEAFEKQGGKVLGVSDYTLGQQNFGAVVTRIEKLDPPPDVIETAAYEPDFPAFIKQLRGAGVRTPILGADAIDTPTTFALGDVVNGVVFTTAGFAKPGNPMDDFNKKYAEEYGEEPGTIYAPIGYDLGIVIEEAVKATGGDTSPKALRDAIASLEDVQGVTSSITYKGSNGMPIRDSYLVKIVDGQRELLQVIEPHPEEIPEP